MPGPTFAIAIEHLVEQAGVHLIELAGALAVRRIRPAGGGDLITGVGIALRLTDAIALPIAQNARQKHQEPD